ncbi:response regulator [Alkalinema sp. FACHB-956]|uniref:response regulator n=1 Tax=Alkalinema sp. FACHB-956 TaxID=2692768 RepID=UPI001681F190|nr:response regulator [Alkalinema sp. FACHB-956]MBD2329695.1 response regulator [Alkalinema sp. FACHB-956]
MYVTQNDLCVNQTVLLIDDDEKFQAILAEILTDIGFLPIRAEDGMQGLQLAKQHHPDLIICDINMPELDGYGVLNAIRNDPTLAQVPFIFLTAEMDEENHQQTLQLGATAYLKKPLRLFQLLEVITTIQQTSLQKV